MKYLDGVTYVFGWSNLFSFLIVLQLCVGKDAPVTSVTRSVQLNGFHRVLETNFVVENILTEFRNCKWAMDQTIPSGAYVDPFQLKEYERSKLTLHQMQIVGSVDIEAAEQHAEDHRLLIFFNETTIPSLNKLHIKFPFHLRYHKANNGGGMATVRLTGPKLLMRCHEMMGEEILEAPCCHLCKNCDWNIIHPIHDIEDIYLQVPVGNLDHREWVTIVTLIMIIGSCYYIISPISEIITLKNV
ncbi:phosphatidylinositol-glycan biosynthesis class X protein-like [Hetaerina americana]|uniref:phosphatidylinositol-glycan biosynthesis class X protein-like n=1 Tax=Hetaerina americana TaxID=62018 RepID=UPI003A7F52C5